MNICLTSRFSPWDIRGGGMSLAVHNIAEHLVRQNHEVTVIYTKSKNQKISEKINYEIEWAKQLNCMRYPLTIAKILKKVIKNKKLDVVHGNGPEALFFPRILKDKNIDFIMSSHYADIWPFKIKEFLRFKYPFSTLPIRIIHNMEIASERYACCNANKIIVFSKYSKRNISLKYAIKKNNIKVVYYGVDPRFFDIKINNTQKNNLLFCGRLVEQKGLDILLKALPNLKRHYKDLTLDVVGDGPCKKSYIQLAQKLGVEDVVNFHGYVPLPNLFQYYKKAKLFVLPSRSESFGIVLAEAMACGLPIVATNVGAIPEVVKNGETGILVKPGDSSALSIAISKLLDNPQKRKEMGRRGTKIAKEKFNWDINIKKIYNY